MNNQIKVGIIGSAGYTGGELIRILINHPEVDIIFVHSNSHAGQAVSMVHTDLVGDTDLKFTGSLSDNIDVLFLCVGHGEARRFLENHTLGSSVKIIDLSQDHRYAIADRKFVYGLPELNKSEIRSGHHISNPGCFATAIQLALLPLASEGLLNSEINVSATTGSTGAGQSLSKTSHFSWRNNNLGVYKAFGHQHMHEIIQSLNQLQNDLNGELHFIPQRGDFARGILATSYTDCKLNLNEAYELYNDYYADHPFVHISNTAIDLKQVVNTNKCLLHLEKHGTKLLITSIIDNLLKGASGQAVQNMNLLFGLDETAGLKLKPVAF